jgi:hypothetical protein
MRIHPQTVARSLTVAAVAVMSAIMVALTATVQTAVSLMAGTALIVPGTGTQNPSDSTNYMDNAVQYYVVPSCGTSCPAGGYSQTPVPYIAQFWPIPLAGWGGLNGAKWNDSVQSGVVSVSTAYGATTPTTSNPVAVFGYSQGATVVSIFKKNLAALNFTDGTIPEGTTFTLIGNPNRPNGGLFERLAILGTVPILDATFGQPTPTDTAPEGVTNTTDTVFQYDGIGDMASNILNVPAVLNALLGFWYQHGTYLDPRGRPPATDVSGELAYGYTPAQIEAMVSGCVADSSGPNCQKHGDTIYVTIPATYLPIIQPFLDLGSATGTSALINPVLALVQPALQTIIEAGYDRQDYSKPTPFQLIPRVNPITFIGDLINDVPEGINAAIDTINDPNHKIPDLPPVWGSQPTTATVAATTGDSDLTATAPTVDAIEPDPQATGLKKRDLVPTQDPVAATNPQTRTHPEREFAGAATAKRGPRSQSLGKAPSRNHAKKAAAADRPAA